jgi:uncharacterized membrane protein
MKKVEKIGQFMFRNMALLFGGIILVMDLIAIAAPILAHIGLTDVSHWIYFVYRFLCHQRPWRSLHLFDYQVAWCTRDTFIYLSMALSAFFVAKFKIRKVKWYVAVLAIIPFALDGTIQMIAEMKGIMEHSEEFFYASTNFMRMLTGTIFGTGAGLWLFSLLDETIEEEMNEQLSSEQKTEKRKKNTQYPRLRQGSGGQAIPNSRMRNLKYFLLILFTCFVTYLGFVQLWRITSDTYKPSGLLDHKRYFPGVNYEEVDRGGHGV